MYGVLLALVLEVSLVRLSVRGEKEDCKARSLLALFLFFVLCFPREPRFLDTILILF